MKKDIIWYLAVFADVCTIIMFAVWLLGVLHVIG